jgi:DNA primase
MKIRGWTDETVEKWGLGFFPANDLLALKIMVRNDGYDNDVLFESGVLRGESSLFFDRVIFPVFNTWGKVVAITGRTLRESVKPKYFNTVFEKSKTLYGLNFAFKKILETQIVYVFEGNADVITAHQHGISNSVCCMGTALGEDHIILLSRYAKNIVLIFDNDTGGQGALKSFNKREIEKGKSEINVFRCLLDKHKDVDEFLNNENAESLLNYISKKIEDTSEQNKLKQIK